MSYTQLLYHIVFSTEQRKNTIPTDNCDTLYSIVCHILKKEGCFVYQIGGVENHIHLLMSAPADKSLSRIIQNLKRETSLVLHENSAFPKWSGWNEGYGAFTCSWNDKERVISYIANQKTHHKKFSADEEFRVLLAEYGYKVGKQ